MTQENIDYDNLKKRGFLRQKQEGFFILRAKMPHAVFKNEQIEKLSEIAKAYGGGFVHTTTRQGIEVPFIKYGDIEKVESELMKSGIETGTSGPRMRTTTCCPGNNWCKSGLIDTFALYGKIENDLGIKCGMDLPHKFKIAISGCPNGCSRPQQSEIGVHGFMQAGEAGYVVYLGGCGGRTPRPGFKLDGVFKDKEVLNIISAVVKFYRENAKPRQRLALLIEETGKEEFLRSVLGNLSGDGGERRV